MAIAMGSALLFGLGPAIQTTRVNLVTALKTSDADTTRRRRLTGRNLLVALQVALSFVLVSVAVWAFDVSSKAFAAGSGLPDLEDGEADASNPSQARYDEAESMRFFERAVDARPARAGSAGRDRRLGDAALLVRVGV